MPSTFFKPCSQKVGSPCCKIWTPSNFLTIFRIFATPFLIAGIIKAQWTSVFVLFIITATTDLLDGYLARNHHGATHLGAILDPVADKIFIFSSFAALAFWQSPSFPIPRWFVFLILIRESLMIIGGALLLRLSKKQLLTPTLWGKLTALFQILFIAWLFICYFFGWIPAKTYLILLSLLAFFSVISFFHYAFRVFVALIF